MRINKREAIEMLVTLVVLGGAWWSRSELLAASALVWCLISVLGTLRDDEEGNSNNA